MEKYYTKCGRIFQKSSTSSVTGYRIEPGDKQCNGDEDSGKDPCPFRIEVTKGWPPVFDRWECRAGSKKPSHKNEYSTNMNDKTTMHVKSLNIDFLNQVQDYCSSLEGCSGTGYNQDLQDCRRQLSISFLQNKKGLTAKKAIVERFFNPDKHKDKTCKECDLFGESAGQPNNPSLHICKHIYVNNRTGTTLPDISACEYYEEKNEQEVIGMEEPNEDMKENSAVYSTICRNEDKSKGCPCYGSGMCGAKEFSDDEFWYRYGDKEYDCDEFIKRISQVKSKREDVTELIGIDKDINSDENILNDHLGTIRERANNIINNYIEIGFRLLEIRDVKLYKSKGYDNLIACVEAELGMKKSTCYNLMRIAEKFGDPESRSLKIDYNSYGYVQLLEMTTMSDEELNHVNPDMSKREIQQIKNSNRLEQKADLNIDNNIIDVDYKIVPESVLIEPNSDKELEIMDDQMDIKDIIPFHCNNNAVIEAEDSKEQIYSEFEDDSYDPEDDEDNADPEDDSDSDLTFESEYEVIEQELDNSEDIQEEYIEDKNCSGDCKDCLDKCQRVKDKDDIIRRIDLAHDLVTQAIEIVNFIPKEHIDSVHACKQSVIRELFNANHMLMVLRPETRCTTYEKEKENLNLASEQLLKPLEIRKNMLEDLKVKSPENSMEYEERVNVIDNFLNGINDMLNNIETGADEVQINEINIIRRKIFKDE